MQLYYAVARAYEQCQSSSDPSVYEEHLWQALVETLKHPLERGNDLVVIVDGLDGLVNASNGPSTLLEKLVDVVNAGKRTRLIALSAPLTAPPKSRLTQYNITSEDVHDDIHAVALRALMHSKHFQGTRHPSGCVNHMILFTSYHSEN